MSVSTNPLLDTTNPDHLLYTHGILEIAILGGIRTDHLDRLRVTLKITVEHLSVRHNLDLYNTHQTDKLIRLVAERLEVGTSVIGAALMELTDLLEVFRLEEREKEQLAEKEIKIVLTEEQTKEAITYLTTPSLMERTKEDIGKSGVVGEENNRLLMYLVFTSRKREHPLHIVSLGSSGIGKTHLQEKVGALIPEEDRVEITTLSENAFYYFGQRQLQNKVVLIEDLDGAEGALFPIRELQTKRKISKTVVIKNTKGETKTVSLIVEGPVSVAGCTTRESLYEDNANRSFLIYIDESKEQDEKVMEYQRRLSAGKVDIAEEQRIRNFLQNTQRTLKPIQVRNPYAEKLKIPEAVFKPRRTNGHYLAFIEAVTFYHQYQRQKQYDKESGEEYIETTTEDIQQANKLMKEVLLRKSDQLTGACRRYFEKLKGWMKSEGKETFMNSEIRQGMRIKGTTLRRYHNQLLDSGLIKIKEGKKATGYFYELTSSDEYERMQQGIDVVLGEMVKRCASEPLVSHRENGSQKQPSSPRKHRKVASEPQN